MGKYNENLHFRTEGSLWLSNFKGVQRERKREREKEREIEKERGIGREWL